MLMAQLRYTFKTDTLFKMLFVKYPELLKDLVSALLGIPLEEIQQFTILNPEMPPESLGDKFCRLDIHMIVNGARVDLEIQITDEGDFRERTMFYWARDFSTSLPTGGNYADLPRTIIISIIDFKLFDCEEYHSFFQLLETTRHTLLSDKMGLHFFELPKLPPNLRAKDMLLLWLSLFKASTEDELKQIQALEVPVMDQAINAYYTITASSEFRERERLYEKARHDEAQALHHAKQEGKQEGMQEGMQKGMLEEKFEIARKMKAVGTPFDQIMQFTDLSYSEVERL